MTKSSSAVWQELPELKEEQFFENKYMITRKRSSSAEKKTRKQRREEKQNTVNPKVVTPKPLIMKAVFPKTDNQKIFFESYENGDNILAHGVAGTGKTFLAIACAMKEISENSARKKLYIVRSAVSAREIGFLPGNEAEKLAVYEAPYKSIFTELYGRSDAYDILKKNGTVQFVSTSFLRGITLRDCIVLVDEIQNANFQELDSIITRLDNQSRIVLSGDYRQSDLMEREKHGVHRFMKIVSSMDMISRVEFGVDDIVRGGLMKAYIIARMKLEDREAAAKALEVLNG